jgi:hypothetical protein
VHSSSKLIYAVKVAAEGQGFHLASLQSFYLLSPADFLFYTANVFSWRLPADALRRRLANPKTRLMWE